VVGGALKEKDMKGKLVFGKVLKIKLETGKNIYGYLSSMNDKVINIDVITIERTARKRFSHNEIANVKETDMCFRDVIECIT
jgi:hypothetical protein